MKRAPVIPKTSASVSSSSSATPAAPMVDSLIARVGAMKKENTIILPVCGREVKFTLETLVAGTVAGLTRVWEGNERDQSLLSEDSLDDLIPSFLLNGQQNPAFGRRVNNVIEVADGSRRRMTAILTDSDYRILVGELDDEQMDALCKLGNDYRPTSAFERGIRYGKRLKNEFGGNISALAEAENISRKIITRCMNTAGLPHEVMALFSHPGELSARSGETLYRSFEGKEELLLATAKDIAERKAAGLVFDSDEIIELFYEALKQLHNISSPPQVLKRQFLPGASVQYKGNKVIISLDRNRLPEESISRIEVILEQLASQSKV